MIEKSKNIQKFEELLNSDENFREKYEGAIKKIADEGLAGSDGEAMVKAAKELGYEISIDEMERSVAEIQELDEEELEYAAGGKYLEGCDDTAAQASRKEDEHGHDGYCWATWHCLTAFLHTKTDSKDVVCWKNYLCSFVNK